MSRQAKFETDIVVKNIDCLQEAAEATAKEMGGMVVDQVRYYTGKVLGIRQGYSEVGLLVGKNGKLTLVGEDLSVHNKEFREKVTRLLKKNYVTSSITRVAKRIGLREIRVSHGMRNAVTGVR